MAMRGNDKHQARPPVPGAPASDSCWQARPVVCLSGTDAPSPRWVSVEDVGAEVSGGCRETKVTVPVSAAKPDAEQVLEGPQGRVVVVGARAVDAAGRDPVRVQQHRADLAAARHGAGGWLLAGCQALDPEQLVVG